MKKDIDELIRIFELYIDGKISDSVVCNALSRANDFISKLNDEKDFIELRNRLHFYLLKSRFIYLAYTKPRGYAGDFTMMQHIYDGIPIGDDALGRLIDKWCLSRRGARAVFNRKGMFSDLINKLHDDSHVIGLACGAATELCDVTKKINYTGIDMDSGALEVAALNCSKSGSVVFSPINTNIIKWSLRNDEKNKYDFIYSAGLIDYFNYGCVRALLDKCFTLLKSGKKLVVGNFAPYEDIKFLTNIMDWKLIYRTEDEFAEIVQSSKFGSDFEIIRGEEGVNLFAFCKK